MKLVRQVILSANSLETDEFEPPGGDAVTMVSVDWKEKYVVVIWAVQGKES